jgi:hypothetical protein
MIHGRSGPCSRQYIPVVFMFLHNVHFYYFSAYKIVWAWNQNERTKEPKKSKGRLRVSPIEHTPSEIIPPKEGTSGPVKQHRKCQL